MDEIDSPEFNAVWDAIKMWDIRRYPGAGYAGATGTDVITILYALEAIVPVRAAQLRVLVEAMQEIAALPIFHDEDGLTIDIGVRASEALAAAARIGDGE